MLSAAQPGAVLAFSGTCPQTKVCVTIRFPGVLQEGVVITQRQAQVCGLPVDEGLGQPWGW